MCQQRFPDGGQPKVVSISRLTLIALVALAWEIAEQSRRGVCHQSGKQLWNQSQWLISEAFCWLHRPLQRCNQGAGSVGAAVPGGHKGHHSGRKRDLHSGGPQPSVQSLRISLLSEGFQEMSYAFQSLFFFQHITSLTGKNRPRSSSVLI